MNRASIEHDLREACGQLDRAEARGDGAAIAEYSAEVDDLLAQRDALLAPEDDWPT